MTSKAIYRMSSAGKCPRALCAEKLGYEAEPAPVWLEQAANEGKWHEGRIVNELKEHDNVFDQQLAVSLDFPAFTLVGHIDGKIQDYDNQRQPKLLEIKTMSQFEFDRWMKEGFKGFQEHAAQITCYMHATSLHEALYIVKNRSSGYSKKEVLTEFPADIAGIISNITIANNHVLAGELVPKEYDPFTLGCRRCEYKKLCIPEQKELTAVEETTLLASAVDWRNGKRLVKEGEQLVEQAKSCFEQQLKALNVERLRFNELAIATVHVRESKQYPKGRLLEVFTEEQLEPASEIRLPYDYVKVSDLLEKED